MIQRLRTLALLAIAMQASAQETPPPELSTYCKQVFCRAPHVELRVDAQRRFEQQLPEPVPVLLPNGWVAVYPGETVYLEAKLQDGKLTLLRAVAAPHNAENTLVLKFEQQAGKPDMLLTITNPFSVDLRFRMGLMSVNESRLIKTSSCPISAGQSLFEHWPHAIFQLILADPTVLGPNDDHSCT